MSKQKKKEKDDSEDPSAIAKEAVNDENWSCMVTYLVEKSKEAADILNSIEGIIAKESKKEIVVITPKAIIKTGQSSKKSSKNKKDKGSAASKQAEELTPTQVNALLIKGFILKIKKEGLPSKNTPKKGATPTEQPRDKGMGEPFVCGPHIYFVLLGFNDIQLPYELDRLGVPLVCVLGVETEKGSINKKGGLTKTAPRKTPGKTSKKSVPSVDTFWANLIVFMSMKQQEGSLRDTWLFSSVYPFTKPKEVKASLSTGPYECLLKLLRTVAEKMRYHVHYLNRINILSLDQTAETSFSLYDQEMNKVCEEQGSECIPYMLYCLVEGILPPDEKDPLQEVLSTKTNYYKHKKLKSGKKLNKARVTIVPYVDGGSYLTQMYYSYSEQFRKLYQTVLSNMPFVQLWKKFGTPNEIERLLSQKTMHALWNIVGQWMPRDKFRYYINIFLLTELVARQRQNIDFDLEFKEDRLSHNLISTSILSLLDVSPCRKRDPTPVPSEFISYNVERYNYAEILTKEALLHRLCCAVTYFPFSETSYVPLTDSMLFYFYGGSIEMPLSMYTNEGLLLTPVGFNEFCESVYPNLKAWLHSEDDVIKSIDKERFVEYLDRVRRAECPQVCCAIDREKVIKTILEQGTRDIIHIPIPSAGEFQAPKIFVGYDLANSRVEVKEKVRRFVTKNECVTEARNMCFCNEPPLLTILVKHTGNTLIYSDYTRTEVSPREDFMLSLQTVYGARMTLTWVLEEMDDPIIQLTQNKNQRKTSEFISIPSYKCNFVLTDQNNIKIEHIKKEGIEYIKQTNLNKRFNDESCRTFMKDGTVISYFHDGTCLIRYSNATETYVHDVKPHTDPVSEIQQGVIEKTKSSLKSKVTVEDTAQSTSQDAYVESNILLNFDTHTEVIGVNGERLKFESNVCCKREHLHPLRVAEIPDAELFIVRETRSETFMDGDGGSRVHFSDGTRITSRVSVIEFTNSTPDFVFAFGQPEEEEEVLGEEEGEEDVENDFCILEIKNLMEHPNYCNVSYKENTWTIYLSENQKLEISDSEPNYVITIDNDNTFSVFNGFARFIGAKGTDRFGERIKSTNEFYPYTSAGEICSTLDDFGNKFVVYQTGESELKEDEGITLNMDEVPSGTFKEDFHEFFIMNRDLSGLHLLPPQELKKILKAQSNVEGCLNNVTRVTVRNPSVAFEKPMARKKSIADYLYQPTNPIILSKSSLCPPLPPQVVWLHGLIFTEGSTGMSYEVMVNSEFVDEADEHIHANIEFVAVRHLEETDLENFLNASHQLLKQESLKIYLK